MNQQQYQNLLATVDEKIYGQFVGLVTVTGDGWYTAQAFRDGWRKVTVWNFHLPKKTYFDIMNSSTGAIANGIAFKPLRESYYDSEGLNGFFSHLKRAPEKKYLVVKFDADKTPEPKSVYLDPQGQVVDYSVACQMAMPSALKTSGKREEVKEATEVNVKTFSICVENVARIKIAGQEVIDSSLQSFLAFV